MKVFGLTITSGVSLLIPFLFVVLSAFIPMPRNASTIVLVVLILFIVFQRRYKTWSIELLFFLLFFLLQLVGIFWSESLLSSYSVTERKLPILIVPFIFLAYQDLVYRYGAFIKIGFLLSCTFLLALSFSLSFLNYHGLEYYKIFFYHDLANQVGLSALYFSLFLVFCSALAIDLLLKGYLNRIIYYFLIMIVSVGIIMLASRIALISWLLLLLLSFCFFWNKPEFRYVVYPFFLAVIIGALAIFFVPLLNERVKEAFNHHNNYTFEKVGGGTSFRLEKWKSAWKLIKRSPLIGYGTGDVQDQLNLQYQLDNHPQLYNYDVHNQYLQTTLAQGLIGLFALVLLLFAPLLVGNHSFLSYSFILIFCVCIITESMLEVQKGVLFFAFFSSYLVFERIPNRDITL